MTGNFHIVKGSTTLDLLAVNTFDYDGNKNLNLRQRGVSESRWGSQDGKTIIRDRKQILIVGVLAGNLIADGTYTALEKKKKLFELQNEGGTINLVVDDESETIECALGKIHTRRVFGKVNAVEYTLTLTKGSRR